MRSTYGSEGRENEDQQEEAEVPRSKRFREHEDQGSHDHWYNGVPVWRVQPSVIALAGMVSLKTYMKNQYRFWNLSESTLWTYDQRVMKM